MNCMSMIGLGYIGLPTAALFASRGVRVIGVDVSQHVVDTVNRGEIHIVEPELDEVVRRAVADGHLSASTTPQAADVFVIAVPTPFNDDRSPDLGYIESAASQIAPVLKRGDLVILESTSPIGATEKMAGWLADARPDLSFPQDAGEDADVQVAHCPERVLPGHVIRELVENDRIIGGMTAEASRRAVEFYGIVVEGECVVTNARTAEMCKLTENSFRDVNIAFANELSLLSDKFGIDVRELISLANRHPRVDILQPGAGVGGHCIAVDPWFIVASAPELARMIGTARAVNDGKPAWVRERIRAAGRSVGKAGNQLRVACLGVAFKPDIDDLRSSPAMEIAVALAEGGAQIDVVEPNVEGLPDSLQGENVALVDLDTALGRADVVAVLVRHAPFVAAADRIEAAARVIDVVGLRPHVTG